MSCGQTEGLLLKPLRLKALGLSAHLRGSRFPHAAGRTRTFLLSGLLLAIVVWGLATTKVEDNREN